MNEGRYPVPLRIEDERVPVYTSEDIEKFGIEEERLRRWLEEPPTWASDDERGIFSEWNELKIGLPEFYGIERYRVVELRETSWPLEHGWLEYFPEIIGTGIDDERVRRGFVEAPT